LVAHVQQVCIEHRVEREEQQEQSVVLKLPEEPEQQEPVALKLPEDD
jgi:hypothetical protein